MEPKQKAALDEFINDLDILNALADKHRQRIIILLGSRLKQGMTVSELTSQLDISQPAVSHHLKILRSVHMVDSTRNGLENNYFLTLDDTLDRLERIVKLIRESNA
ncbi:transcription regulator [Pediococcus damnosus]|uniref:Transcription regulator n=2 Tax=Pediococcus damnosus TaxID=51663 RepID=A0A0R2HSN8_9LACO|nr:metalloregulator ArsR/SmtB family transcription factor [Pediococcus damnosus]AMV59984.1 transcription regulator [Pediococcus damnosus]AMV62521.1 transcription regulator [Pediococcus damnosus]AMV64226.1 transcription regulator [Pediococcus damnosus]AMV67601.1 transcription regulator [Pediococcus damnosus]AMV69056.1 transcription regulator [Pediococcus damnosus]